MREDQTHYQPRGLQSCRRGKSDTEPGLEGQKARAGVPALQTEEEQEQDFDF